MRKKRAEESRWPQFNDTCMYAFTAG